MRKFKPGDFGPLFFEGLTEQEKLAWLNPERGSYHSLHIERMAEDKYFWRDSKEQVLYTGTLAELTAFLSTELGLRKIDPKWQEAVNSAQVLKILSDDEIEDLFKDL